MVTIWGPTNWVLWHVVVIGAFLNSQIHSKSFQLCKVVLDFGGGMCHWFLPMIFPSPPGPTGFLSPWVCFQIPISGCSFGYKQKNFLWHLTVWGDKSASQILNAFKVKNCPPRSCNGWEPSWFEKEQSVCLWKNYPYFQAWIFK